jgi:hypothetical protein
VVVTVAGALVGMGAEVVVGVVVVLELVVLVVAITVLVVDLVEVVGTSDDVVGRLVSGEDVGAQATTVRTAIRATTPFVADRLTPTNRIRAATNHPDEAGTDGYSGQWRSGEGHREAKTPDQHGAMGLGVVLGR